MQRRFAVGQRYKTVIGKTAHIYESSDEGQTNIVLVFDELENKETVVQPVVKRNAESDFSARIEVLEEELKVLRTLIQEEAHLEPKSLKANGLGRIRTGDLRHVKALSMACSASRIRPSPSYNQLDPPPLVPQVLSELALPFTLDDLTTYAERRKYGLSKYSIDWIDRSQKAVWSCTNGIKQGNGR